MKRDQCNLSARIISLHDAQHISQFREELRMLERLRDEGWHSHKCAQLMLFEGQPCSCSIRNDHKA